MSGDIHKSMLGGRFINAVGYDDYKVITNAYNNKSSERSYSEEV
jgi:hypothetical protein